MSDFDPAEGRRLLQRWDNYAGTARGVISASGSGLAEWLWKNREALISAAEKVQAMRELEALLCPVENQAAMTSGQEASIAKAKDVTRQPEPISAQALAVPVYECANGTCGLCWSCSRQGNEPPGAPLETPCPPHKFQHGRCVKCFARP